MRARPDKFIRTQCRIIYARHHGANSKERVQWNLADGPTRMADAGQQSGGAAEQVRDTFDVCAFEREIFLPHRPRGAASTRSARGLASVRDPTRWERMASPSLTM
jgi:hypothetical protein